MQNVCVGCAKCVILLDMTRGAFVPDLGIVALMLASDLTFSVPVPVVIICGCIEIFQVRKKI